MLKWFLLIVAVAGLAFVEPAPKSVSVQGGPVPVCPPFCR